MDLCQILPKLFPSYVTLNKVPNLSKPQSNEDVNSNSQSYHEDSM